MNVVFAMLKAFENIGQLEPERRKPRVHPLDADTHPLDFTVRLARTEDRILQAVKIREAGFDRHHPWHFIDKADRRDRQFGSVVFVTLSKGSEEPLGSLRIETNRQRQLSIESEIKLPSKYHGLHCAHVSRLSTVPGGGGRQCRNALFKALYLYSVATEIRYLFVLALPPIERLYYRIGFQEVFKNGNRLLPQQYRDLNLHLLSVQVDQLRLRLKSRSPELYQFIFLQRHPDIRIFESVSNSWETFRKK